MGNFDVTSPANSDFISLGAGVIRTDKLAIQEALRGGVAEGTEAVFPGAAPTTAPIFRYRGLVGTTGARPAAGQYGLYFDTSRQALQRDNGVAWVDIAGGVGIVSGVVMVFYQASAPTGWTAVAANDKFLRVVSAGGTGGTTGGTHAASTDLTHYHTIGHTHTVSHSHTVNLTTSGPSATQGGVGGGGAYAASSTHDHNVSGTTTTEAPTTSAASNANSGSQFTGSFAYADIIIATKD